MMDTLGNAISRPHSRLSQSNGFKDALLNVQLDAIAALVDEQATRRLWKLFTTCAGSIAHGRRLENLSWRCWSRDQSLLHNSKCYDDLHVANSSPRLAIDHRFETALSCPGIEPTQGHLQPGAPRTSSYPAVTPDDQTSLNKDMFKHSQVLSDQTDISTLPTTIAAPTSTLSFPRFESTSSTSTLISPVASSTLSHPPLASSTSFSASRSPPLGPLIKRVIFTPPSPRDHAAAALGLLMTSREQPIQQEDQHIGLDEPQGNSPTNPQPEQSQRAAFPTVVILESTPKPTPPDTPARGLSPSETSHRPGSLSPLHALAISATSPLVTSEQSETSNINLQQSTRPIPAVPKLESPSSSSAAVLEKPSSMAFAPAPAVPVFGQARDEALPYSSDSRRAETSLGPESLLDPTTTATSGFQEKSNPFEVENSAVAVAAIMAPSTGGRMFFLQRDSSSLSPDSNSRSGSHSRSPGSTRSPDPHAPSNSPGARNGESSAPAGEREGSENSRTRMSSTEAEKERVSKVASESINSSAAPARETPKEVMEAINQPEEQQQQVNMSVPAASSSSSSHTYQTRPQRLVMRSKKGGYRPHIGRGGERPSSRNSNRGGGSIGSRGSAASASGQSASSTNGRTGRTGGSGGAGSMDVHGGSMNSMSTSAGSNIIMKRHVRVHSPLRNAPVSDGAAPPSPLSQRQPQSPASTRQPLASGSGQPHSQKQLPHITPLAVLPDPLRMEVLERQVMQTAMKSQSDGRKISLESDSEDDYTDDDEVEEEESEDDEIVVVQKDKGKSRENVAEEEDGSSWSDEDDDEDVVVAKKRQQTQQKPAPTQPSRRNSRDLDHLVESAGDAHVEKQLPHVKSKGKIHNHHYPHGHGHAHAAQRGVSPPARPAAARKTSAGHTRGAPSQDGPLAQAAREALRQRDMFTPLPRDRYSSTNLVREKSRTSLSRGGRPSNLTMLLNPDPQWFPQNHPYRQNVHPMDQKLSRSMEELYARGPPAGSGGSGMKSPRAGLGFGGLKMTTTAQPSPRSQVPTPTTVAPPTAKSASPQQPSSKRGAITSKSPPSAAAPTKLRPSKSAIAVPLVLGVTASSTPRDEKQADMLEMSLRQMGPQRQRERLPRPQAPATSQQPESKASLTRPSSRLPARPADIEYSDTEDEAPTSPAPKVAGSAGRSLAKEHLEAVMGGKSKSGLSASKNVIASPDALPKGENDPTSYRPPAPPSSPSVYNPYEAKRAQGHLPHTPTPPSSKRSPVARAPRIRPHSSHGQPTAPVISPPAPQSTAVPPQRERRQPATSQPPIPVTTAPLPGVGVPWPYNLPYPAPVQSPRTTRLNMLASEVPDDLRKDLLWERKTNRIAPLLDNRTVAPQRRNVTGLKPMTNINSAEAEEESDQARREREAKERYDKMRTQTWNGVIYQRPVW